MPLARDENWLRGPDVVNRSETALIECEAGASTGIDIEQRLFERDIAEMALAHKVGDEVEQAYRRGTALKKRRKLMEAWARYVEGASNVVRMRRSA